MRIGIDAYPLAKDIKAGISYYSYYIIKNILEADSKNEYFLYNSSGKAGNLDYPNLKVTSTFKVNPLNKFSTLWMLYFAKKQLIKDNIDIFWGIQGIIPLNLPDSIKTVSTIYDLTFFLFPATMSLDNYFVNKFFLKKAVRKVDRIFAISKSTANDVKKIFRGNIEEKMSAIHIGYNECQDVFGKIDKIEAGRYVVDKLGISDKYILFVGTIEPRKNIIGLLRAFKIIKSKYKLNHQLVIAGGKGWKVSNIFKVYKNLSFGENEVKFLGYVDEEALAMLYSGADLFVNPSFYEGFGMPSLEAMACGAPVVASDIPVFREVLGDAAYFTDSRNPESLAKAMQVVLTSGELRGSLCGKGKLRYQQFSWKESAKKILSIFESLKG
ncbi:MAG: glycosyltransferase family 1 protein [Candidatus Omnitrophota bacterium]